MPSAQFPAVLESLAPLRAFIKEEAARPGLDGARLYRLILAVDEVATNIIVHGYQENDLSGDIDIEISVGDHQVTVRLLDDAIPFDPTTLENPDDDLLASPLHLREEGGLGMMLALDGVDAFSYKNINGRNENTFTLNF